MSTNVYSNTDGTDFPQSAREVVVTVNGPETQDANAAGTVQFKSVDGTDTPVNTAGWVRQGI